MVKRIKYCHPPDSENHFLIRNLQTVALVRWYNRMTTQILYISSLSFLRFITDKVYSIKCENGEKLQLPISASTPCNKDIMLQHTWILNIR